MKLLNLGNDLPKEIRLKEITRDVKRGLSSYYLQGRDVEVSMINIKDIANGRIVSETVDRVSVRKTPLLERARIETGDVVMAIRGFNFKAAVAGNSVKDFVISANLIALTLSDKILPEMISAYFNSPVGRNVLQSIARGATIRGLNSRDILDIIIPLPSLSEQETGDKELAWNDPDEHQFFVPERARWESIRKVTAQIGDNLNKACSALEDQNPMMEGVLNSIDFNSDRLGDVKQRDGTLLQLVQHFSAIPLKNSDLENPDVLGDVYEYLIEKFADDAGKKGGEFYTPRMVVKLLVAILDPKEGMRVADPTAGSGGMLIEAGAHVKRNGGNPKNLSLFGQEKNIGTWGISKMNMLLHGLPDADIRKGDVIREPKLLIDGQLMLFDRVIANPPFSLDKWGYEVAESDGYGRFHYGVPPKTKGDFAFVEHMIATLNQEGKMGVVVPHGVLFRGGAEGRIREGICKEDIIEAVIGLPAQLFYGTGIPAAILIINKNKPRERRGSILFIDGSQDYLEGKKQNKLRPEDIEKIVAAYNGYKDVPKYCRVVPLSEIEENDYNLNISRYVDTAPEEEQIDVAEALMELKALEARRREIESQMDGYLKELGYGA